MTYLIRSVKKCSNSKWGLLIFIIIKQDKTVRFTTDFCIGNSLIKHKPYLSPKIQDLLQKL